MKKGLPNVKDLRKIISEQKKIYNKSETNDSERDDINDMMIVLIKEIKNIIKEELSKMENVSKEEQKTITEQVVKDYASDAGIPKVIVEQALIPKNIPNPPPPPPPVMMHEDHQETADEKKNRLERSEKQKEINEQNKIKLQKQKDEQEIRQKHSDALSEAVNQRRKKIEEIAELERLKMEESERIKNEELERMRIEELERMKMDDSDDFEGEPIYAKQTDPDDVDYLQMAYENELGQEESYPIEDQLSDLETSEDDEEYEEYDDERKLQNAVIRIAQLRAMQEDLTKFDEDLKRSSKMYINV